MSPTSLRRAAPLLLVLMVIGAAGCRSRRPPKPGTPHPLTRTQGLDDMPAFSPDGTSLAYVSDRSGPFEIWIRSLKDGKERRLTRDSQQNVQPTWSPDGSQIAYHSRSRGGIWVVPTVPSPEPPQLLADFGSDPSWSPKGGLIAFQSQKMSDIAATSPSAVPPSIISVVGEKGGVARDVTHEARPPGGHGAPFWSQDGKRILFITKDPKLTVDQVWSVSPDGSDLTKVFEGATLFDPVLAADGTTLYFGSLSKESQYGVFRTSLTASAETKASPELVAGQGYTIPRSLALSPDGTRLVWSSRLTFGNLWSLPVTPDGAPSGPAVPLTEGTSRSSWPLFSPNGKEIAFGRCLPGRNWDIWVMDPDGRGAIQLTFDPTADFLQDWFPKGDRIFFIANRTKGATLWALDRVTGRETQLPLEAPDVWVPRMSPDGKTLAYNSRRGSSTINIWLTDMESGRSTQLTHDRELLGFPCWSPDGTLLGIQVKRGDDVHIAVMPRDGGNPTQLTSDPGLSWPFTWSPDGQRIAFAGLRKNDWNLFWVSRTTKEVRKLTSYTKLNSYVRYPSWSPKGDQIVYEYGETTGSLHEVVFTLD